MGGAESLYLFTTPVLPNDPQSSHLGANHARWYVTNGASGLKPENPEMIRAYELLRSAGSQKTEERNKIAQEIWKILVDQQYGIGTVGQSPAGLGVRVVSNKLGNIAGRVCNAQHCRTPGNSHPELWYFKS